MKDLINWLESHSRACTFRKLFGFDCPGCGFQRAFVELLKGNVYESILIYPPLLPILVLIALFFSHLIFKINNGAKILKYSFVVTVAIIFLNYLYKLISQ